MTEMRGTRIARSRRLTLGPPPRLRARQLRSQAGSSPGAPAAEPDGGLRTTNAAPLEASSRKLDFPSPEPPTWGGLVKMGRPAPIASS
jgi:hypothetical protein